MSLNKAITYGKEKRKPYRHSKAFDRSCRNHGKCLWCYRNRMYSTFKQLINANEQIKEIIGG
jgi:hypothetical protein